MKSFALRSLAALLSFGLVAGASAQGTDWPAKQPLTLIVPFGPGSSPDTMARAVAEEAGKTLQQTIVVQNKPGASGNLGTDAIAKAKPDGYTFGVSITGPLVNNTVIYKNLPYKPATDLTPLTLAVHQYNVLVVPANSPIKSLPDLVAEMKKPGAKLNFPSTGAGTVSHLAVELLLDRVGGKALHVPYKSSPDAVTSLLSGDTTFAALPPVAAMPMVQDGRLRAIAAVSAKRLSFLPDTPTMAELGYPGVEGSGWIGFVAPAGIPADVKTRLNAALTQALASPAVGQRLKTMHMEPAPTSPEAFGQYMAEELQRWSPLIKRLNLAEN
ncbi:Bug family tripartite tricarboxylate transporter substrate binding protein [Acidovorax sp. SDU_ACID1]|jgi:tripartite-type tricarboxylate transporter receptor subunit TctC|uniref:Bug family tripartite tricarboxylate transporter substrate binding protein n=1 Tax=Acidovorax sp. SDU_ACID1 TaxID=3136632 RepID=UPI003872E342